MTHTWIPILISKLISLLQATTLRERYYTQQQRIEILETAIDDIERINANSSNPSALIANICSNVKGSNK
jgi:hypothetical protein